MSLLTVFKHKIDVVSTTTLHTNKLGLARSLLAFGTLSSFLFNDANNLFNPFGKPTPSATKYTSELSFTLFSLLGDNFALAKIICMLVLALVIWGVYPRFTCLVHWYISWSYFNSTAIVDGGDQVTSALTLLLLPICLTDKRKNHWLTNDTPHNATTPYANILNHAFYLIIQVQISLLYFEASVGKFKVDEWSNGTSVYYWFNQAWFGAPAYIKPLLDIFTANKYGVTMLTWGTLIFELVLFTGLFMSTERKRVLLFFGIGFHFSILVLFGLFSFYFAMCGALVLYLGNLKTNFTLNKSLFKIWRIA